MGGKKFERRGDGVFGNAHVSSERCPVAVGDKDHIPSAEELVRVGVVGEEASTSEGCERRPILRRSQTGVASVDALAFVNDRAVGNFFGLGVLKNN